MSTDDAFWDSMGDLRWMQELADLLDDLGTADVTPHGITLRAADGRELARIYANGHGTFNVCLVLAAGFGAKAARKRSESGLAWFEREVAPKWREHGFTTARYGGDNVVEQAGERRWAVVINMSFNVDKHIEARFAWAREHALMDLPPVATRPLTQFRKIREAVPAVE